MNKLLVFTLVIAAAFGAITNKVAYECVSGVTIPQEVTFAFNYGVDCNKFHNGLVNQSTQNNPVSLPDWKGCRDILFQHFTDDAANAFYKSIDSCVNTGKATITLRSSASTSTVTNEVANACVTKVTLPAELSFAFNYGVDCNKFHNGLVNESTKKQQVNIQDWNTCKNILAGHFTDDEAKTFYAAIDQCVTSGKAPTIFKVFLKAASISNKVANDCISKVTLPQEISFAYNYGVDCNKFHNGLVNESTQNDPVSLSNWKVCRDILSSHFTDAEATTFLTAVDSCVNNGKTPQILMDAVVTNEVASACVTKVTLPNELSFAFNYGVDCNKFHNGLVNESTKKQPVSVQDWTTCKNILADHFSDAEAKTFFAAIDQCVSTGKAPTALLATTISNKVANDCINTVTLPQEISFAYNYGVDCNKFHNGIVNESTQNDPVSLPNWKVCRDILSQHFTDSDANSFYLAVDSCVNTGKKPTANLRSNGKENCFISKIFNKIVSFFNQLFSF